ncbi:MAG TPA: lysylphosphatidylglycerol synthase transmembrane domain-containing protein [Anaerolineae bacterium]|nr:lysylphosphatidylglycerol synthase transmembrane domain-containing protein [Anaerolineae bacterium]HMR63631.1 lysylphosphatidylglycerol synthase transmembrane domain-containing protein [Anaerolineae bacterium]
MKKSYLKYGLHLAIIIGLIIAGVKYLSGDEVWAALKSFDFSYAPLIVVLATGYVFLHAWRFLVLTRPYTDILGHVIFRAYLAGQAATLLPGGMTARAGLLKQANVPVRKGSVPVFLSSGFDQAVLITGGVVAALWFGYGQLQILLMSGFFIALALPLLIPAVRQRLEALALRLAQRFNLEEQWQGFVEAWPKVFTWRTMAAGLGLTIVALVLHFVALDLVLQGLDQELDPTSLALVYILPTVLGRLSGLPGGFGVTEAGMVGLMTTVSGFESDTALAIAAIFRIATIVYPALLGVLVYLIGWRGEAEATASVS